jgi:hypothetical protein
MSDPDPTPAREAPPPPADGDEEVPAGSMARLLLVATPFVLLIVLYLLDRLVRG